MIKEEKYFIIKPFVVNKNTNVLYRYEGGNLYTNMLTDKFGEVDENIAKDVFSIPVSLNILISKYPNISSLIHKLKFSVEVISENGKKIYNK